MLWCLISACSIPLDANHAVLITCCLLFFHRYILASTVPFDYFYSCWLLQGHVMQITYFIHLLDAWASASTVKKFQPPDAELINNTLKNCFLWETTLHVNLCCSKKNTNFGRPETDNLVAPVQFHVVQGYHCLSRPWFRWFIYIGRLLKVCQRCENDKRRIVNEHDESFITFWLFSLWYGILCLLISKFVITYERMNIFSLHHQCFHTMAECCVLLTRSGLKGQATCDLKHFHNILLIENINIFIPISLKFIANSPLHYRFILFLVMSRFQIGNKSLYKPMISMTLVHNNIWASWRFKSLVTELFVQQLVQVNKHQSSAFIAGPLQG